MTDELSSDPDRGLADWIAGYVERLQGGEEIEPEEILGSHPDLGPSILEALRSHVDLGIASESVKPQFADYTLRRELGRGGMGVVYEAWQHSLDRRVALKILPASIAADPRASTRFLREAQIAARLQHPHIVSVHASGVEGSTPYYAMDLIEGESLARVLARMKESAAAAPTPFGPARTEQEFYLRVARAFADVAEGLQHAHEHKVIHRDLKPSNLILERDGRLKILDFGLAHLEGQATITLSGDVLGTPQYMSPEQARRKKVPVDHRTDIWSLGATMYETFAGCPPFQGKDHNDTLSQIIERDPVEPRKVNPRVPKDLETIVLKCLRKDAADRYGTAEAMGQDLRRFVRGEVIEARPQTGWERGVRRAWRLRRAIAAWLLVLLVTILIAGQVLSWRREKQVRLEKQYDALVRQAVLRLKLVPTAQRDESGRWDWWINTDPSIRIVVDPAVLASRTSRELPLFFRIVMTRCTTTRGRSSTWVEGRRRGARSSFWGSARGPLYPP